MFDKIHFVSELKVKGILCGGQFVWAACEHSQGNPLGCFSFHPTTAKRARGLCVIYLRDP